MTATSTTTGTESVTQLVGVDMVNSARRLVIQNQGPATIMLGTSDVTLAGGVRLIPHRHIELYLEAGDDLHAVVHRPRADLDDTTQVVILSVG